MKHWSPTDTPIQSEHAKRANSSIMECEEFILQLGHAGRRLWLWPSDDDDDNASPLTVLKYMRINIEQASKAGGFG